MPYPGINEEDTPKVDRCVKEILADKKFKPNAKPDERKSSAIAICISSIKKDKEKMKDVEVFKQWTVAYINDLPDSSFFYIESGGKKDKEGKTVPRSLRHLPYKDSNGKLDLPHVRNAIARVSHVKDKNGKPLSESLVNSIQERARKLLGKDKGENKMKDDKEVKVITKFEEESVIQKVQDIIAKLEAAENLETAKGLVPELRALLPESPVEEKKEEAEEEKADESKEEVKEDIEKEAAKKLAEVVAEAAVPEVKEKPVEEPVAEEAKVEQALEEPSEVPAEAASLSEVLDLNDKLITKLKEATDEIDRLEKENTGYKSQVDELTKEVSSFKEAEKSKEEAIKLEKFNAVFDKYVHFFKVKDEAKESIRKEMSTFSEGILENIAKQIDAKKLSEMKAEPEVDTKPSSELEGKGETAEEKAKIQWNELTPQEQTKFLFEKVKQITK